MPKKRIVIQFIVTAKEKASIQREAKRLKMTMSEMLRWKFRPAPNPNLGAMVAAAWEKAVGKRPAAPSRSSFGGG